jgi:hypothetical protein
MLSFFVLIVFLSTQFNKEDVKEKDEIDFSNF